MCSGDITGCSDVVGAFTELGTAARVAIEMVAERETQYHETWTVDVGDDYLCFERQGDFIQVDSTDLVTT